MLVLLHCTYHLQQQSFLKNSCSNSLKHPRPEWSSDPLKISNLSSGLPGRARLVHQFHRRPRSIRPRNARPAGDETAYPWRQIDDAHAPGGWVKPLWILLHSTGGVIFRPRVQGQRQDRVKTGRNAGKSNKNLDGHGTTLAGCWLATAAQPVPGSGR